MGNEWIETLEHGSTSMDDASSPLATSPLRRSLAASLTSSNSSSSSTSLAPPRFVCARCRSDLTLLTDVIWEGVMGQRSEPAFLSRRCVNLSLALPERRGVQLSSGTYDLVDVECRRCREPLGWRYLRASGASAEKFKVACTLLAAAKLERAVGLDDDGERGREQEQPERFPSPLASLSPLDRLDLSGALLRQLPPPPPPPPPQQ